MAINSVINGRLINALAINASGSVVVAIDVDMTIAVNQTPSELTRVQMLEPYGITTFTSTLSELTRARFVATDGDVVVDQTMFLSLIRELIVDGDIRFDQELDIQLVPPMVISHSVNFAQLCALDYARFGHWNDGTRMVLAEDDRGLVVNDDYRLISVPPDPVRTAAQKTVRVPRDNRRISVPRDPYEVVPQKALEVVA